MPAVAIWFIGSLVSAFFAPDILKKFADLFNGRLGSDAELLAAMKEMQSVPQVKTPTAPTTPNSEPEPNQDPTTNQIISKAVEKPSNWFGLALFMFALIFILAQLRAGAHEAISYAGDALDGAKKATGNLANADGSTGNISRRAKS